VSVTTDAFDLHAARNLRDSGVAHQAAEHAADTADRRVVDDDLRLHVVVGGDALAFLLFGASTVLAGTALQRCDPAQTRIGLLIADRRDDEAVRLLDGEPQQRFDRRDLGRAAEWAEPVGVAAIVDCDRAEWRGAAFQRFFCASADCAACRARHARALSPGGHHAAASARAHRS
jgi:hypothetical protein